MATPLADQRIERVLDITGSRVGTEERAARMIDGRSISSEYDPHYNEKYGTTLTNAQSKAVDEGQSQFATSVAGAKNEWQTANDKILSATNEWESSKNSVASQYGSGMSQIEAGYGKAAADIEAQRAGLPVSFEGYKNSLGGTAYSTWQDNSVRTDAYYEPAGERPAPTKMDEYYQEALSVATQRADYGDMGSYTYLDNDMFNQRMDELVKDDYIATVKQNPGFNTFYSKWLSTNAVPVLISNPVHREWDRTFYVDRATADKIASTDLGGYGGAYRTGDGGVVLSSDTYAGSFYGPLVNYERNTAIALSDAYVSQMPGALDKNRSELDSSRNSQVSNLNTQYQTAQSDLATYGNQLQSSRDTLSFRQQEIAAKEAENVNMLNTVRAKYSEKLSKISNTIGTLFNG